MITQLNIRNPRARPVCVPRVLRLRNVRVRKEKQLKRIINTIIGIIIKNNISSNHNNDNNNNNNSNHTNNNNSNNNMNDSV